MSGLLHGPYDIDPLPEEDASNLDLVFEGGKPLLVFSYGEGKWMRLKLNNDQLWHLHGRMAPKLRGR